MSLKAHLTDGDTWIRGLFMVLFAVIYSIAEIVLAAVVVFQFGSTLITGGRNERLLGFGAALSRFIFEVLQYLTYNREEKPFPFGPWPGAAPETTLGHDTEHPDAPPPAG